MSFLRREPWYTDWCPSVLCVESNDSYLVFKDLRARRDRACWRVWVSDNIDIWASGPDGMDGITREESCRGMGFKASSQKDDQDNSSFREYFPKNSECRNHGPIIGQ